MQAWMEWVDTMPDVYFAGLVVLFALSLVALELYVGKQE